MLCPCLHKNMCSGRHHLELRLGMRTGTATVHRDRPACGAATAEQCGPTITTPAASVTASDTTIAPIWSIRGATKSAVRSDWHAQGAYFSDKACFG